MPRDEERYPAIARVLPASTDARDHGWPGPGAPSPVRRRPEEGQHPVSANDQAPYRAPYWRAVLEERWRQRLEEVTELSVAYHGAAAPGPDGSGGGTDREEMRRLLRRTVAARRGLADAEEALGRLAAGNFGRCEQCGSAIPDSLLAAMPETRYCPRCATGAAPPPVLAIGSGARDTW